MGYEAARYTLLRHYDDGDTKQLYPSEYFILRKGDLLATGTLWNYLSNISLILEIMELPDSHREHLEDLRNAVSALANDWQGTGGKLPD